MPKTVTVTLAGTEYLVPKMNVGQLEEMTDSRGRSFDILRIALRRAEPKVADVNAIEADPAEISAAVKAILECAGLRERPEKNG